MQLGCQEYNPIMAISIQWRALHARVRGGLDLGSIIASGLFQCYIKTRGLNNVFQRNQVFKLGCDRRFSIPLACSSCWGRAKAWPWMPNRVLSTSGVHLEFGNHLGRLGHPSYNLILELQLLSSVLQARVRQSLHVRHIPASSVHHQQWKKHS